MAVELQDVHFTYNARTGPVQVAQGMNLHVNRGEFVSLVGPSGCGKSTIFRLVAGLLEPSAGHVRLGGEGGAELPLYQDGGQAFGQQSRERWEAAAKWMVENKLLPQAPDLNTLLTK